VKSRQQLPESWEPAAPRQPSDDRTKHPTNTGEGGRKSGGESPELSGVQIEQKVAYTNMKLHDWDIPGYLPLYRMAPTGLVFHRTAIHN